MKKQHEFSVTIAGNPVPKARPRVVNKRAYTPRRTAEYESIIAHGATLRWAAEPMCGRLAVTLRFFRKTRHVCDIDNLCKSILDGLEGIIFKNDNQIDVLHAERDIDTSSPRVEITIEEIHP